MPRSSQSQLVLWASPWSWLLKIFNDIFHYIKNIVLFVFPMGYLNVRVQVPSGLKILTQFRVLFATYGGGGHSFLAYKWKFFSRIPQIVKNTQSYFHIWVFIFHARWGRRRGRARGEEILEIKEMHEWFGDGKIFQKIIYIRFLRDKEVVRKL